MSSWRGVEMWCGGVVVEGQQRGGREKRDNPREDESRKDGIAEKKDGRDP